MESKKYVVMKARQVGSEIRDYDLRSSESNTLDPTYLKVQQIVNAPMHEYICQILCLFVRDSTWIPLRNVTYFVVLKENPLHR